MTNTTTRGPRAASPAKPGTRKISTSAWRCSRPPAPSSASAITAMTGRRVGSGAVSSRKPWSPRAIRRRAIVFDDATNNPHFSYREDDDSKHEVWFLDGVTAFNQIHAADPYQPAGYALWRLGARGSVHLAVLGRRYDTPAPARPAQHSHERGCRFRRRGRNPAGGSRSDAGRARARDRSRHRRHRRRNLYETADAAM